MKLKSQSLSVRFSGDMGLPVNRGYLDDAATNVSRLVSRGTPRYVTRVESRSVDGESVPQISAGAECFRQPY